MEKISALQEVNYFMTQYKAEIKEEMFVYLCLLACRYLESKYGNNIRVSKETILSECRELLMNRINKEKNKEKSVKTKNLNEIYPSKFNSNCSFENNLKVMSDKKMLKKHSFISNSVINGLKFNMKLNHNENNGFIKKIFNESIDKNKGKINLSINQTTSNGKLTKMNLKKFFECNSKKEEEMHKKKRTAFDANRSKQLVEMQQKILSKMSKKIIDDKVKGVNDSANLTACFDRKGEDSQEVQNYNESKHKYNLNTQPNQKFNLSLKKNKKGRFYIDSEEENIMNSKEKPVNKYSKYKKLKSTSELQKDKKLNMNNMYNEKEDPNKNNYRNYSIYSNHDQIVNCNDNEKTGTNNSYYTGCGRSYLSYYSKFNNEVNNNSLGNIQLDLEKQKEPIEDEFNQDSFYFKTSVPVIQNNNKSVNEKESNPENDNKYLYKSLSTKKMESEKSLKSMKKTSTELNCKRPVYKVNSYDIKSNKNSILRNPDYMGIYPNIDSNPLYRENCSVVIKPNNNQKILNVILEEDKLNKNYNTNTANLNINNSFGMNDSTIKQSCTVVSNDSLNMNIFEPIKANFSNNCS